MTSHLRVDVKFSSVAFAELVHLLLAALRRPVTIPPVGNRRAGLAFARVAVQPVNALKINTLDPE